jgi:hypothetical protein
MFMSSSLINTETAAAIGSPDPEFVALHDHRSERLCVAPTIANGKVNLGTPGSVEVFGLKP